MFARTQSNRSVQMASLSDEELMDMLGSEGDSDEYEDLLQRIEREEGEDSISDAHDSGTEFSTPRAALQAEIYSAKADRFLRAGLTEAAARECCRALGELKDDEHLKQKFLEATRRVATSIPNIEDLAVAIDLQISPEAIIGEPLDISVNVDYQYDADRAPEDGWLGLYPCPAYLRNLLHDGQAELSDFDLRSTPELGQISRISMPKQKSCELVFPADASLAPCPPGQYEVRWVLGRGPSSLHRLSLAPPYHIIDMKCLCSICPYARFSTPLATR